MDAKPFPIWLRLASLAAVLCACTTQYPESGVIGTSNTGRVLVKMAPADQDSTKSGEMRIVKRTDSIAEVHTRCIVRLDSSCSDTMSSGSYRAEIWIANKLSGKTGWFEVQGASKIVAVSTSKPSTLDLAIQTEAKIDSVLLGSRGNAAALVDGKWQITALVDSSDVLWVKIASGNASTWLRYTQSYQGSSVVITPVSSGAPTVTPTSTLVLTPGNSSWFETTIIGGFAGTTIHDDLVYSTDTIRGLGAAWDATTIGRTLWRIVLPDSLRTKTVLSAKLLYHPSNWGVRPGTAVDYHVEAHKMLRSWNVGTAGYGAQNSSTIDGATTNLASWGVSWTVHLVGLDGTDAESAIAARDTLSANSMASAQLDITAAVQGWLAAPATNFGLITRSPHEAEATFPDYPVFWSSTARDTANRPRLILEISP